MADIKFERGKELTYPGFYPKLTFTPVFGHRGDFIWVEEVIGAWPEHDSEFSFVRSAVHDQRVDRLMDENARLKALLIDAYIEYVLEHGDADTVYEYADRMRELGIEVE